jgi:hypothetical protein
MLTVLGPYAATGVENCSVFRADRATAREFTDKRICFATPDWRAGTAATSPRRIWITASVAVSVTNPTAAARKNC